MGSRAFSGPRGFTEQLGRGRVHGSAVIRMERSYNVAGIQVSGKIYPSMSGKMVAPDSNWNCGDTPRPFPSRRPRQFGIEGRVTVSQSVLEYTMAFADTCVQLPWRHDCRASSPH
jgi:hypothetical protein